MARCGSRLRRRAGHVARRSVAGGRSCAARVSPLRQYASLLICSMATRCVIGLLVAGLCTANAIVVTLGAGALKGVSAIDASAQLNALRARGVQRILSLDVTADSGAVLLSAGALDAIVDAAHAGTGAEQQMLAAKSACGSDEWVHVASAVDECSVASALGACVILLDEAAAADDAFEVGYTSFSTRLVSTLPCCLTTSSR